MESFSDTWNKLATRWSEFGDTRRGRRAIKGVRALFLLAIVAVLAIQLTAIGWLEILSSLPTAPLFYILFLLLYLLIPAADMVIYRRIWVFDTVRSIPAFIKKRIYNKDVLGYSGELYFFSWARNNIEETDGRVFETIRDTNIISAAASTTVALILLAVFLGYGEIGIQDLFGDSIVKYVVGGAFLFALLIPVAIRFRRYIFAMPVRMAAYVFGIHGLRLALGQMLQIGIWIVVLPDVSVYTWFTFAAVSIILTRIPFLPNQGLIFLGFGVELSGYMDISQAEVAAMLLLTNVLDKLLNIGLFGLINVLGSTSLSDGEGETGGNRWPPIEKNTQRDLKSS